MKRLLLIAILFTLIVPPVSAQDEPECDTEAATLALETALENLDSADDPLAVITEARRELARIEAECLGLGPWEGDSDQVIGPIEIPEGIYRVEVETDGFFIMDITTLNGECGPTGFGTNVFNLFESDLAGSSEGRVSQATVQSEGCEAILEISNVAMGDYTLTFEKLD